VTSGVKGYPFEVALPKGLPVRGVEIIGKLTALLEA